MNRKPDSNGTGARQGGIVKVLEGGLALTLVALVVAANCVEVRCYSEFESCTFGGCDTAMREEFMPDECDCTYQSANRECFTDTVKTTVHVKMFSASNAEDRCNVNKPYCNWNTMPYAEFDIDYNQSYQNDTMCY